MPLLPYAITNLIDFARHNPTYIVLIAGGIVCVGFIGTIVHAVVKKVR